MQVKSALEQGAVRDLDAFLDGLHQLEASNSYLQRHHKLAASRQALGNAQKVFDRALEQCGAEFSATVAQGGKSCLPSPAWLLEHVKDLAAGGYRALKTHEGFRNAWINNLWMLHFNYAAAALQLVAALRSASIVLKVLIIFRCI